MYEDLEEMVSKIAKFAHNTIKNKIINIKFIKIITKIFFPAESNAAIH